MSSEGFLRIDATAASNNYPVSNVNITVRKKDSDEILAKETTDLSGQSGEIALSAPPLEFSLKPVSEKPYSEYNIFIQAEGFEEVLIEGSEILPDTLSVQPVRMFAAGGSGQEDAIMIGPHTLYGDYPPKIPEAEIKPVAESGEIVLARVVVPEIIVVHDGVPTDTKAKDYYVPYADYIKNVACSEIYSTWSKAAIEANVLAIMSFTLNRVYTEWYRNKGYDFTITSSTAYDQKWIYGRNIFEEISLIVDELVGDYISLPNVKQPVFTQYCDGKSVTCPGWLSQWGSESLGSQGYSAISILRNYYGSDVYINTAEQIAGIPSSYPGTELDIGSSGDKVRQLQEQLLLISNVYTSIPALIPDGFYGENTASSVKAFQKTFGLPQTGVTDFRTWYKVSQLYVALARLAEFPR